MTKVCYQCLIVKYLEICLYMEYVPCGELYDLIAQNTTLTEVEARGIFEEMVNVVSYLHSIGITHRDIKPENILIDEFGHIKLCDFGMSNIFEPNQLLYTPCGSPHYSAPELILGKGYHPQQSEVWTLGILLYACCCGTLPFLHENTPKLFQLICEGVFDFPEIQLSSTLKDLVRKMLVVEPEKRLTFDQILYFCQFFMFLFLEIMNGLDALKNLVQNLVILFMIFQHLIRLL